MREQLEGVGRNSKQRRAGRAAGQLANGDGGQPLQQKNRKENRVDRQSPQAKSEKENGRPGGTDDPPMTNFPFGKGTTCQLDRTD
jgi:hypothetical protein